MSDQSTPDSQLSAEVEIDLAAFLPDDVTIDSDEVEPAEVDSEQAELVAPTSEPTSGADPINTELLDAVEKDLSAVDAALKALDDGSYGFCAVCRTPLAADSLAVDPVRLTCPEHA